MKRPPHLTARSAAVGPANRWRHAAVVGLALCGVALAAAAQGADAPPHQDQAQALRAQREAQLASRQEQIRRHLEAAKAREAERAERIRRSGNERSQKAQHDREQALERAVEQNRQRSDAPALCRKLVDWYLAQGDVPEHARKRKNVSVANFPAGATAEQLPFDVWMLEDSRLLPLTGKAYDAMTAGDFEPYKTALSLGRCIAPHRRADQPPAPEELLPKDDAFILARLFHQGVQALFAPGVKLIRSMRAQAQGILTDATALTADEAGLARYRDIAHHARRIAGFLPDAQRKSFEEAVDPSSPRVQAMLRSSVQADMAPLGTWGRDLDALEQGARWQAQMNVRYEGLQDQPLVREAAQAYRAWRTERLLALRPQLDAMIKSETTPEALERLTARYLADARGLDPQLTALVDSAAARRQRLARERDVAGSFSERERELMTPDLTAVVVPARYGPPTAQEMKLAFVREMEALGQRRHGPDSFDFGIPFPLLREMSVRAVVRDIQIDACQVQGAEGGYRCKYRLALRINPGEAAQKMLAGSIQLQMLQATYDLVNQAPPAPHEDHFVLRDSGWRSDTIRGKGVKALANTMQTMADNFNQAARTLGCMNPRPIDRLTGRCP